MYCIAAQLPKLCPAVSARSLQRPCVRSSCSKTHPAATRLQMICSASSADSSWTIVGGGRVGEALAQMGSNDVIVRRGEPIPEGTGPIIVATRNDDLESVITSTPTERQSDLVFIQNGMLQPFLDRQGLGNNTQVLLYIAVAKRGDAPQDGGLTQAFGLHAAGFAERLVSNGVCCTVPGRAEFRQSMLEKLIWICAYMLVGARYKVTVGEVEQQHRAEVDELVEELATAGAAELRINLAAGSAPLPERLADYTRSVSHFPTAVKEFAWRNGWFWDISKARLAAGQPDPCPKHTALLREVVPQLVA